MASNNSTTGGVPYFQDPFDCTCTNDNGSSEEFENFWKNSGSCCDNLRLTIWIIFNVIFFILVFFLCIKIQREKKVIQRDLEDFEPYEAAGDDDQSNSNADSLNERLNR